MQTPARLASQLRGSFSVNCLHTAAGSLRKASQWGMWLSAAASAAASVPAASSWCSLRGSSGLDTGSLLAAPDRTHQQGVRHPSADTWFRPVQRNT